MSDQKKLSIREKPAGDDDQIKVYSKALFEDLLIHAIEETKASNKIARSNSSFSEDVESVVGSPRSLASSRAASSVFNQSAYNTAQLPLRTSRSVNQGNSTTLAATEQKRRKQQQLEDAYQNYENQKQEEQRKARERERKRETVAEQRFNQTISRINSEQPFVDQVEQYLSVHQMKEERKKHMLYEEWNEKVYENIQRQINNKLDPIPASEIQQRRLKEFDDFLTVTNTKDGLFRDIIIESDYDPLKGRAHTIRYNSTVIKDPLKQAITQTDEEKNLLVAGSSSSPERSLSRTERYAGRDTLDPLLWDKIESTPHGHYAQMFDSTSPTRHNTRIQRSSLVMDHFNTERDQNLVDREFFPSRKAQVTTQAKRSTITL
eukprot:TRINITY_DN6536_c0_g2_i2.p1 TRINITY_DN6536_c0_g2~~TRINITY_DN6536_c0_g2_i2.p1  ORF type:complete len:376 (-),score=36.32 TRINITY_DN6536_c0_g2_i2:126-1253(-)